MKQKYSDGNYLCAGEEKLTDVGRGRKSSLYWLVVTVTVVGRDARVTNLTDFIVWKRSACFRLVVQNLFG